jgi:competence protein ComEC
VRDFWERQPALFAGLCLLLGAGAAICWEWGYLLPGGLLLVGGWKRAGVAVVLVVAAFGYTQWIYPEPEFSRKEIAGQGIFHIENLKLQPSPFHHRSLQYRGKLLQFTSKEGTARNLPCTLHLPYKKERPLADRDYAIEGTLKLKGARHSALKVKKGTCWEAIGGTSSLAEWRYQAKEKLRNFLKKEIPDKKSAAFLTALATGEVDERGLSLEFCRLGLQHILAISGFHFALIAAFFNFFLRLVLKPKVAAALLFLLISGYFFFIGSAPSVERAWIAISMVLMGQIFSLRVSALNALGMGLIIEILLDPLLVTQIGFQLSFLATLAILTLYSPLNLLCAWILPKEPLETVTEMSPWDQHLYLLGAFFRNALSLNLAIHLATIPLLLFLFHKFPLLSLGYNLFFPLGATLSLLLLLTGGVFNFLIPPLGHLLHQLNSGFTAGLLQITAHPPALLNFILRVEPFSITLLLGFFTLLFLMGIKAGKLNLSH